MQSSSLPWHEVDLPSYQGVMAYVGTHYPPSLLLSTDSAPQLLVQSLRSAAGLWPRPHGTTHRVSWEEPGSVLPRRGVGALGGP